MTPHGVGSADCSFLMPAPHALMKYHECLTTFMYVYGFKIPYRWFKAMHVGWSTNDDICRHSLNCVYKINKNEVQLLRVISRKIQSMTSLVKCPHKMAMYWGEFQMQNRRGRKCKNGFIGWFGGYKTSRNLIDDVNALTLSFINSATHRHNDISTYRPH